MGLEIIGGASNQSGGELDSRVRALTRAQINSSQENRDLYALGQRIVESGIPYVINGGSAATAWTFRLEAESSPVGHINLSGAGSSIDMDLYSFATKDDISALQQFTLTNIKAGDLVIMLPKDSGGSLHTTPFIDGDDAKTFSFLISNSLVNFNEAFDAQLKLQIYDINETTIYCNAWIIE